MFSSKSLLKIGIIALLVPLVSSASMVSAIQQGQLLQPHSPQTTLLAVANQRRVALVIGNSKYQTVPELRNPANDATDMAKALADLGFEVIIVLNANQKQMDQALVQFKGKLTQGGVGLFYYAGHGIQVNGENYLIPIDAKLNSEKDVNYQTLPLGEIQNAMEEAKTDANILILDACRNNPFSRSWQRSTGGGGLAAVQAVAGSYIAFATAPGKTADDGEGRNGRFTSYLLKNIKTPNLNIEELFKRVRQGVAQETNKEQIPWDSSSLIGQFSFNQEATTATSTPSPLPIATTPTTQTAKTTPREKTEQLDRQNAIATPNPTQALPDIQPSQSTPKTSLLIPQTQEKPRIAVLDFDYSSISNLSWFSYFNGGAKGVSDILVNKLVQSGQYTLIERSRLDAILQEQNLGVSGRIDASTAAQIGRILGVDAVIIGSITQFDLQQSNSGGGFGWFGIGASVTNTDAYVKLNVRLVSTTTAEILTVAEGNGNSSQSDSQVTVLGAGGGASTSNEGKLLTMATEQAVDQVTQTLNANASQLAALPKPLPTVNAVIAAVTGNQIILNKGNADGYRVGMQLSIERVTQTVKDPQTGKVLRQISNPIGLVELIDVDSQSSVGRVIAGSKFKVGDVGKPTR